MKHYEPAVLAGLKLLKDLEVSVWLGLCVAVAVRGHQNRDSEDGQV